MNYIFPLHAAKSALRHFFHFGGYPNNGNIETLFVMKVYIVFLVLSASGNNTSILTVKEIFAK